MDTATLIVLVVVGDRFFLLTGLRVAGIPNAAVVFAWAADVGLRGPGCIDQYA